MKKNTSELMESNKNQYLENIFNFLNENREYNKIIQFESYKRSTSQYPDINKKVYSLLHHILNTQPQLRMDKSCEFFKKIYNKNIDTFENLLKVLDPKKELKLTFKSLFELLVEQDGWGKKTSALFVKAIYNMHNGYAKELKFWNDVPELSNNDELYIPVDIVIRHIFSDHCKKNHCKNDFKGINKYIKEFSNKNIDIWDDLWFWGFITQSSKGKKRKRIMKFNESKYWNLKDAPKDELNINKIKKLSEEFLTLI